MLHNYRNKEIGRTDITSKIEQVAGGLHLWYERIHFQESIRGHVHRIFAVFSVDDATWDKGFDRRWDNHAN